MCGLRFVNLDSVATYEQSHRFHPAANARSKPSQGAVELKGMLVMTGQRACCVAVCRARVVGHAPLTEGTYIPREDPAEYNPDDMSLHG